MEPQSIETWNRNDKLIILLSLFWCIQKWRSSTSKYYFKKVLTSHRSSFETNQSRCKFLYFCFPLVIFMSSQIDSQALKLMYTNRRVKAVFYFAKFYFKSLTNNEIDSSSKHWKNINKTPKKKRLSSALISFDAKFNPKTKMHIMQSEKSCEKAK